MKKLPVKYMAVYLVGFPLAGILLGIGVFLLFDYINGPLNKFALYLSVGVWGGYGFFSGIYGYLNLRKMSKFKSHNHDNGQPK